MATPLAQALMGGAGPQTLTPAPFKVANTDVAGIHKNSFDAQMDIYKQKQAEKNAMWGGLASLAGTGLGIMTGGASLPFTSALSGGGGILGGLMGGGATNVNNGFVPFVNGGGYMPPAGNVAPNFSPAPAFPASPTLGVGF